MWRFSPALDAGFFISRDWILEAEAGKAEGKKDRASGS
jgi:hypothetical protein